jgi:hypothetical protein
MLAKGVKDPFRRCREERILRCAQAIIICGNGKIVI